MRLASIAALLAMGCGKDLPPDPAVHVVLELAPAIEWRADEIREVFVEISVTDDGEVTPVDKLLPVPSGAFDDGRADFDYEYDEGDTFDLYVTAGTGEEAVARGEVYELALEPQEIVITLEPFTSRWTSPEDIDGEVDEDASGPRVVVDSSANVTAVWASGNDVWSNGGEFGAGWEGAAAIGGGDGAASRPRIAIDGPGAAFLVWEQIDGGASNVFAMRRAAGGAWPAVAEDVDYSDAEIAVVPEIAVGADGSAISTYVQTWEGEVTEEDRRSIWGGFWDGTQFLDAEPLSSTRTDTIVEGAVALAVDGRAFVVWQTDGAGMLWNHYAATENPEGREPPYYVLDAAADAAFPRVAADGTGDVFTAWASGGAVHARVEEALDWVDLQIPDAGGGEIGDVEVVADGVGGAVVAYVRGGAAWAVSWDGAWSEPEDIGVGEDVEIESDVALASDGDGAVFAVFVGTIGGMRTLWATERTEDGWRGPAAVVTAEEISSPQVGTNGAGNTVAVWLERAIDRTRVRSSLRGL